MKHIAITPDQLHQLTDELAILATDATDSNGRRIMAELYIEDCKPVFRVQVVSAKVAIAVRKAFDKAKKAEYDLQEG